MNAQAEAVFAIDGGGTGCTLALEHRGEVHTVEAGPANAFNDFDGAVTSLGRD